MQLALVLAKAGNDATGDFSTVNGDPDLLVRYATHVVRLRGSEGVEPELSPLAVPPFEHRLRHRAVREASETRPAPGSQACERLVGSCTDSDVVGMPEDAVGAERHDNSGLLLLKDPRDRRDNVIEGKIRDATIRQTQPLVTVRDATECSPRAFILSLPDGPKRLWCGRESVSDVPLLAEGGVNQDEPEVWLIRVQRDTARSTVRVVVWMREDTREGSVAHIAQYRFRDPIAARGNSGK